MSCDKLIKELEKKILLIKKNLLKLCSKEVIHIGGDLSIVDVMTVLWQYKINYNPNNPQDEFRDRFILSKGHASAVTAFNQAAIGCFNEEDVYNEYATDEGRFSMHSCRLINPFVEVSTGSLGHGMPIACGIAMALKLKNNFKSRVYTIMGDGELSEGSIWEAVMNASHYKLGNLVGIVDYNGLQADGTIEDITGLNNISEKFKAFNWNVIEIDGHNVKDIISAFDNLPSPEESYIPTVLICHTVKGNSIDFMENSLRWHAGRITIEDYEKIIKNLEYQFNKKWDKLNDC